MPSLSLNESIKLAQIEPADGATMLRSVAVKGAQRFLDLLPPGVADLLGLASDAAAALEGLQGGDVGAWLNLLQTAQDKWIGVINTQWDLPQRCRDEIRIDAAERTPVAAWSQVPIALACGVGEGRKPGRYYWKPAGIGPRVENWAHDLPPSVLGKRQTWIPDPRLARAEGYVFCPALLPYCIPGERPTTWGEGVSAVMAKRYQELLMDGADDAVLDDLFYRTMAIINAGRLAREGVTWAEYNPVKVVAAIPNNPDPGYVYATPKGELWAVGDNLRIYSYWNHDPTAQTPIMTATVGELKAMLASLGGLMVRQRLADKGKPSGGIGDPLTPGGGGIPAETWKRPAPQREGRTVSAAGDSTALVAGAAAVLGLLFFRMKGRR